MKPLAFLAFALALHAQSSITVAPGGTFGFTVTQATGSTAGDQWTFSMPAFLAVSNGAVSPVLAALGKSLTCNASACIVTGQNSTLIPAGPMATFTATISPTATGSGQLAINMPTATDASGGSIPTTSGPPATVTIQAINITIKVFPKVMPGKSIQMIAKMQGATSATWTISPAIGTVSSGGLYTAPAALSSPQTITITATAGSVSSSDTVRVCASKSQC